MPPQEIAKIGKRGTLVIPVEFRKRFALKEGSMVLIESCADGLSLRPAVSLPMEIYSPERKAEFLLTNAVGRAGYRRAVAEVRRMGLDPRKINHKKPPGA